MQNIVPGPHARLFKPPLWSTLLLYHYRQYDYGMLDLSIILIQHKPQTLPIYINAITVIIKLKYKLG